MAAAIVKKNPDLYEVRLTDVIPRALGIKTKGNRMNILLARNRQVPCYNSENFKTTRDNQTRISIRVFEGESLDTRENHLIGRFEVEGLPKKPAGEAEIMIKFDVDLNGILIVTAIILDKEKKVITNSIDLHGKQLPPDFDEMIKRAERLRIIDEEIKMVGAKISELERLCEEAEKGPENEMIIESALNLVELAQTTVVHCDQLDAQIKMVKQHLSGEEVKNSPEELNENESSDAKKMKIM